MKQLLLLLFAALAATAIAQTPALEQAYLTKEMEDGRMTSVDVNLKMNEYRKVLNAVGGYPQLPIDSASKDVKFEYILDAPGISKTVLMKRIKEWCAINYVDLAAVSQYEDVESGKFILKGYVLLPYRRTYDWLFGSKTQTFSDFRAAHTVAFTVKDGKVKYRVERLVYQWRTPGATVGSTYLAGADNEVSLRSVFPLIAGDMKNLRNQVELILSTKTAFEDMRSDLLKYMQAWQEDYKF